MELVQARVGVLVQAQVLVLEWESALVLDLARVEARDWVQVPAPWVVPGWVQVKD